MKSVGDRLSRRTLKHVSARAIAASRLTVEPSASHCPKNSRAVTDGFVTPRKRSQSTRSPGLQHQALTQAHGQPTPKRTRHRTALVSASCSETGSRALTSTTSSQTRNSTPQRPNSSRTTRVTTSKSHQAEPACTFGDSAPSGRARAESKTASVSSATRAAATSPSRRTSTKPERSCPCNTFRHTRRSNAARTLNLKAGHERPAHAHSVSRKHAQARNPQTRTGINEQHLPGIPRRYPGRGWLART